MQHDFQLNFLFLLVILKKLLKSAGLNCDLNERKVGRLINFINLEKYINAYIIQFMITPPII